MEQALRLLNKKSEEKVLSTRFGGAYALGVLRVEECFEGQFQVKNIFEKNYIYQGLFKMGKLVSSNDPCTLGLHKEEVVKAHGSVLTSNVGLGGFLYRMLRKKNIWHITVVEPDLAILNILERTFVDYADRITFINCKLSHVVNSHVYDTIYHP